jgi:hypothetical protein
VLSERAMLNPRIPDKGRFMSVKVCKHILVIVLPLLLAACAATSQTNGLITKKDSEIIEVSEPEEYMIYSALINQKYIRNDVRLIVISDRTFAHTVGTNSLDKTLEFISKKLNISEQDLLKDFLMKNQQSYKLKAQFDIKVKYVLVNEEEKSQLSQSGNFWSAFDEKYPNAQGILSLSRVGFNHAMSRALVYIGNNGSASTGAGYYVLLVKSDGKWVIQVETMAWVV